MNLKAQLAAIRKELRDIHSKALEEKRDFTDNELTIIETKSTEAKSLKEKIDRVEASEKALQEIVDLGRAEDDGAGRERGVKYLTLTGERSRKAAAQFAASIDQHGGVKALAPGVATGVTFNAEPLDTKKLPTSILDLLRVKDRNPTWRGIRQTGFVNNATVVPAGATKPTSELTIESTEGFLVVVAHLSEYVDTYMLSDNANLTAFIDRNLFWGLKDSLEEQIFNGTGTDDVFDGKPRKNITGIMATSGVQEQEATAEPIVTLRAASTKLETAGFTSEVYVLNPLDWEAIETNRNPSGNFDLGSALNLAERRVWGTRVVTSSRIDAGVALAMDLSVLNLDTDGAGISTLGHFGEKGFETNAVRFRTEGRFGLTVEQPEGIVVVELTPTP